MKQVICLLNGLTDKPLNDLGGKTPLEKASCEHLDFLAHEGDFFSLSVPRKQGMESALLAMLGVIDVDHTVSQGVLEASALGFTLSPQQSAYALRFISAGNDVIVDVSDELLSSSEGALLCKDLNTVLGEWGWHFLHLNGARAVLISDYRFETREWDLNPYNPIKALGKDWRSLLPQTQSKEMMDNLLGRVDQVLRDHEINALRTDLDEPLINGFLMFHGGPKPTLRKEGGTFDSSELMVIADTPATIGVAKLLGIDFLRLPQEEKKFNSLEHIFSELDAILERKNIVIIELNYLWKSTYKGDLLEKVKGIEYLDRNWVAPLTQFCHRRQHTLTLLPLQHTSIEHGGVLPGNVPCVIYSPDHRSSVTAHFDEKTLNASTNVLPMFDLMGFLMHKMFV